MQSGKALLVGLGMMAVALAGCSGVGGDSSGFSVKHVEGTTYKFTANGKADNYTWDLGDRLTQAHGKSVTHTYDFENGQVNVVLVAKKGTTPVESRKSITLGNGQNEQATFILEGETNWTVVGETFKLSASASTDPDGDPLRYSWSCVRTGDAVRTATHSHGFGGVPYATPPAGAVTARVAEAPLPDADKVYDGDLCEALGPGSRPTTDATIEGRFLNSGIYDIYLLASDPVHPSTSGKFHFVVSDPDERPSPTTVMVFNGTFEGGAAGTLQGTCGTAEQCGTTIYDKVSHPFQVTLSGLSGSVLVEITSDASTLATLNWTLIRGSSTNVANGADGAAVQLDATDLPQGSYRLDIQLDGGVDVGYRATFTVDYDMDPFKVY